MLTSAAVANRVNGRFLEMGLGSNLHVCRDINFQLRATLRRPPDIVIDILDYPSQGAAHVKPPGGRTAAIMLLSLWTATALTKRKGLSNRKTQWSVQNGRTLHATSHSCVPFRRSSNLIRQEHACKIFINRRPPSFQFVREKGHEIKVNRSPHAARSCTVVVFSLVPIAIAVAMLGNLVEGEVNRKAIYFARAI